MKKIIIPAHLRPLAESGRSVLNRSDYRLFPAGSIADAYRIHKSEKVNLIITDARMARSEGLALLADIRRDPKLREVSLLHVTEGPGEDIPVGAGINHCLTGPVDLDRLSEAVVKLLSISQRTAIRAKIRITVKGTYARELFVCRTLNISASGILIETAKILSKGNIIACSLEMPGAGAVTTEGEVVRTDRGPEGNYRYGVHFSSISEEARQAIERFVRQQSASDAPGRT